MSQGFHKGNIFSFSDEFERPQQQNHIAQQSRRDNLRVLQQHGFDAAAEAAGHPLVAIQEEEEEEEEDVGIYGRPAGTSNMLISEMFNFPAPDELVGLHLTATGLQGAPASSTAVMSNYHDRLSCQQRRPADSFYGCNRPDQGMTPSSTTWSSVVLAAEDSAKHHGIMNPDSSAGTIRRFFDNSSAAGVGRRIQPSMQQLSPSPPTSMGGGAGFIFSGSSLQHHHHNNPHRSQTSFLGPSFGESLNLVGVGGEVILERQLGRASLSLSSSELQQLEMTRPQNQMRVSRSEQGDHSFFFLNSSCSSSNNEHQEDDELPAPQPFFHQQAACNQQGQQAHMISYGPVAALSIFRNSLYARAAQELLEEFCSVGRGHLSGINKGGRSSSLNNPPNYPSHIRGGAAASSAAAAASSAAATASSAAATSSAAAASSWSSKEIPPLSSADRFESQRKKSKLLSMLDEVERRYNHYCEQMHMVVNSFESAMGLGAATPYTALAHKAMSRHFRCLKDAITGQLKQTCELLGDKLEGAINGCSGSGGLTKVETPKLRLIDQSLRQQQQRALLQHHDHLGMMDQAQPAWRPQRGLPDRSVTMLRAWLFDHFLHPYPSDADKHLLARQTGLTRNQVSNWFINARVRLWKPMVEDMYQKEAKEAEDSQQQQQQHNDQTINSHSSIILSAATTRLQHDPHNSPTLIQPNTYMINSHPQPQPEEDDVDAPAASPLIFSPHNDMYRRPAAMLGPSAPASQARTTTGDLSLTLGLRHAGVNPPETGRFGL